MLGKRRARFLAVVLALAVCTLSTLVVAHTDGLTHNEDHCTCQLCHAIHASIPQLTARAHVQRPLLLAGSAPQEQPVAAGSAPSTPSIPRAPPA